VKNHFLSADRFLSSVLFSEFPSATPSRGPECQEAARREARAKARAMADAELGLSPPIFIDNLKDRLRRNPSQEEAQLAPVPVRPFCSSLLRRGP